MSIAVILCGCAAGATDVDDFSAVPAPSVPLSNGDGAIQGGVVRDGGAPLPTGAVASGYAEPASAIDGRAGAQGVAAIRDGGIAVVPDPDTRPTIDTGSTGWEGAAPLHPEDAGFTPPNMSGGAWKLDPGSDPACPPEPPPLPIIGGICLGIYFTCGWTNANGDQYGCICDWVHWLCI